MLIIGINEILTSCFLGRDMDARPQTLTRDIRTNPHFFTFISLCALFADMYKLGTEYHRIQFSRQNFDLISRCIGIISYHYHYELPLPLSVSLTKSILNDFIYITPIISSGEPYE